MMLDILQFSNKICKPTQKPSLLNKTNIHCRNKLKYIQFTPILCSFHLSSNSAGVCKKHVKYKTMNNTEYLHNTAVD